jgi:hypothetical protein
MPSPIRSSQIPKLYYDSETLLYSNQDDSGRLAFCGASLVYHPGVRTPTGFLVASERRQRAGMEPSLLKSADAREDKATPTRTERNLQRRLLEKVPTVECRLPVAGSASHLSGHDEPGEHLGCYFLNGNMDSCVASAER